MKRTTKRIATAASVVTILLGISLLLAGQWRTPPDIPPSVRDAVVEPQQGGQERSIDWDVLPRNVVAWVYVPGTSIDYPVVEGSAADPGFYLFHDVEGNYSAWGTPYIANGCSDGLESYLVMIYGHHMSDGTMFADLAKFSDRAFAEGHGEIVLYTPSRTIHLVPKLVNVVNANDRGVLLAFDDQDELTAYMGRESEESEVILGEIPDNSRVYAFVTCSYETSNSRTVVYAVEEVQ